MSERLLEAFREDAEKLTRRPAFELIETAGRRRRRRRHAVGGAVAACLLAVTGFLVVHDWDSRAEVGPADDRTTPSGEVTPYPSFTMTTLREGTYALRTSPDPHAPEVRLGLPAGWNAWMGPNRFEGMGRQVTFDADTNEGLLADDPDWYVGLLVIEVESMAQRECTPRSMEGASAPALARALVRIPGLGVLAEPESTVRFGHRAVHLRLQEVTRGIGCGWFFHTASGQTGDGDFGATYDAWVIDVADRPILVWAEWTPRAPRTEVDALLGIVDSIEVHNRE
jgi:hypothetical protein